MLREPGIPGGTEQRRQEGERGEPESALLVLEPHTVRFERERERDEGRERERGEERGEEGERDAGREERRERERERERESGARSMCFS